MVRPEYLQNKIIDWEMMKIIIGGQSSLDSKSFLNNIENFDNVENFLEGYGLSATDPVSMAELFGNFHESLQFIKRFFLKEGNPNGLDLVIPSIFYTLADVKELFLIAVRKSTLTNEVEHSLWAAIILKVMHTILHTDKDLRYRYFLIIQQQIFDRFYKYIHRDPDNCLYLESKASNEKIKLLDFQTKAKKTRESIIIKLLHKAENVAEELFDRIGVRIVTESRYDVLRVIKFLHQNYVIMANNIKPSRSINAMFDLNHLPLEQLKLVKKAIRENWPEEKFLFEYEAVINNNLSNSMSSRDGENKHSLSEYRAVHFTCRQLIKYKNPFMNNFKEIKKLARELDRHLDEGLESKATLLVKKILSLDTSSIAKDVRFFYPFEVQITDHISHKINSEGEASHLEYKKAQQKSAMLRLFKNLIEYKGITLD